MIIPEDERDDLIKAIIDEIKMRAMNKGLDFLEREIIPMRIPDQMCTVIFLRNIMVPMLNLRLNADGEEEYYEVKDQNGNSVKEDEAIIFFEIYDYRKDHEALKKVENGESYITDNGRFMMNMQTPMVLSMETRTPKLRVIYPDLVAVLHENGSLAWGVHPL